MLTSIGALLPEMNLKEYTIQRSGDGTSWNDLQTIQPKNDPNDIQNYTTKDLLSHAFQVFPFTESN